MQESNITNDMTNDPISSIETFPVLIRNLGCQVYINTLESMHIFTETRTKSTLDEIWILEHPPTFTIGQAGDLKHVLSPEIKFIQVDRGGEITYHGPGQIVCYLLLDLRRWGLKVRELVFLIECATICTLSMYNLPSTRRPKAPGVYIADGHMHAGAKIAFIGLKIRRGCSYHGMSLNVNMDLQPFSKINPCGYQDLKIVDMASLGVQENWQTVANALVFQIKRFLKKNLR